MTPSFVTAIASAQRQGFNLIVGDINHRRGELAVEAGNLRAHLQAEAAHPDSRAAHPARTPWAAAQGRVLPRPAGAGRRTALRVAIVSRPIAETPAAPTPTAPAIAATVATVSATVGTVAAAIAAVAISSGCAGKVRATANRVTAATHGVTATAEASMTAATVALRGKCYAGQQQTCQHNEGFSHKSPAIIDYH